MSKLLTFVLHALLVLAVSTGRVEATNKYPIVLVHGLGGWGRGEFLGVPYWGTLQGDFQEKLKSEGYQVFTVGIGKVSVESKLDDDSYALRATLRGVCTANFASLVAGKARAGIDRSFWNSSKVSSNWDRACELYAQIKGGQVDYGVNHSRIHGHARYGRTYPGLFPQWGTVLNGTLQKIHLMGHSMGGETIRMLAQLLNNGAGNALTIEAPTTHPLFAGGKDWVHSITTVSTPNQGSTLADMLASSIDLIENVIAITFGIAGLTGDLTASIYDPQLDQWGIAPKQPGEKLEDYITRIASSKMFAPGYLDNAGFSLAVKGSAAENSWVKTLPNIYYYSFVSDATIPSRDLLLRKIALADTRVANPLVVPLATLMGSRQTSELGYSDEWLPNDGFVNVISQGSDGVSKVVDFNGRSERGAWTRFKTLRMDHLGMMGANPLIPVYSLYKTHAALLTDLPSHESLARTTTEAFDAVHEAPAAIVEAIRAAQDALS